MNPIQYLMRLLIDVFGLDTDMGQGIAFGIAFIIFMLVIIGIASLLAHASMSRQSDT